MTTVATIPLASLKRRRFEGPSEAHCFSTPHGAHVLLADGSRVYDVPADFETQLRAAAREGRAAERDRRFVDRDDDEVRAAAHT